MKLIDLGVIVGMLNIFFVSWYLEIKLRGLK